MSDAVQPDEPEKEAKDLPVKDLPEFPPVSGGAPTDIVSFDIELHA